MSFFFGYTGVLNPSIENYLGSLNNIDRLKIISGKNIKIIFDQSAANIIYDFQPQGKGLVLAGMPVYEYTFLTTAGIKQIRWLDQTDKIEGHFAGVIFDDNAVEFFNDPLGLRDIYIKKEGSNTIFSTRINDLIKLCSPPQINLSEFSTLWLLPHQISWGTIIEGIERLGPGGRFTIKNNQTSFSKAAWKPDFKFQSSTEDFHSKLKEAVTLPFKNDQNVNLGFSGGMDSRVLLQILLSAPYTNWATHTFGDEFFPDGYLAKKIADELGIKHSFLKHPKTVAGLPLNNPYLPQLSLSSSLSETLNYPFYSCLKNEGYTVIDGAYGEIFRRAYLNRILIRGKQALLDQDLEKMFLLLRKEKAEIFNEEANKKLNNFALENLSNIFNELDSPLDIGPENWLDTFFIKTKVANISGPSQTLLDNLSSSYMPFIQPSVLSSGFSLNTSEKKNERLFKNIIKNGKHNLSGYPLVKDNIYYPFGLNFFSARVLQKIKRKLGYVHKDNKKYEMLMNLRNYAKDKLSSQSTRSFDMYDINKIESLVKGFYDDGKHELSGKLEWWITFEMWRESVLRN